MKKALLLCAAAVFAFAGRLSAEDGLTAVGANTIILPSSYWDGDMEWSAWTWVYKGQPYGDWNSWNPNYNVLCSDGPIPDDEGREWYEPGYDMSPKEDEVNWDQIDEETGEATPIVWEMKRAPYSTDEFFRGSQWPSYRWTEGSVMADIYVRRVFTTDQLLAGAVYLACGHDDAPAEYYINGELVFERTGFEGEREVYDDEGNYLHTEYANAWNEAEYVQLTDEQKALIKLNGEENVIAFHVHQNWGGAFADCGLYTKLEGGLDMGYTTPWVGKVLFNNFGGYNWDGQSPSNNPRHPWSKLYEAQEGDEYSFLLAGSSKVDDTGIEVRTDDEGNEWEETVDIGHWREQLHFKSPIKIEDGHDYTFRVWLGADKPFSNLVVKLTDNDDDDLELAYEELELLAPVEGEEYEGLSLEIPFQGIEVNNFKIAFDFGGGQDSTIVTIKNISLVDETPDEADVEEKELWIGTHYFNFIDMHKRTVKYLVWDYDEETGESFQREATEEEREFADMVITYDEIDAPEITGRVETLAWTLPDFDDSMWDDQMMPVGSADYTYRESAWPGGDNTNYWIRRNFELDKVNERLSYDLNVCHDDVYETYVNGHLLQKNVGWTDGKNPVQVHIPANYLNVGKNVIATYIQQNWGGKFYDCGINVIEMDYDAVVKQYNDIIAYCLGDTLLTNKMKEEVQALVDDAKQYFDENKNDPAELRNYARELRSAVNDIFRYSPDVKILKDTYDICRKMEDKGYWGTALQDAVVALDTCAVPSQWSGTLTRLREARKTTAMERHTENYVGTAPLAVSMEDVGDPKDKCPKYYLYNVGAKNFLGGGEAYDTHLALCYVSTPMMVIQAVEDVFDDEGEWIGEEPIEGAYFIETFRPNGTRGVNDFLGWNGFIDRPLESKWELIPVEGKQNVYNIAQYGETFPTDTTYTEEQEMVVTGGGKKYLGWRNGDNTFNPSYFIVDTDMRTPELESNQWMFVTREELLGFIPTASEENPVDLSFLIGDPGYDTQVSGYDGISGTSYDYWTFFGCGRNHYVFESYNTNEFNIVQSVMPAEEEQALPNGTYKLMVQGYYRDGIEDVHLKKVLADTPVAQQATIFAGPTANVLDAETMSLMPIHIDANKVPGIGYKYGGLQVPGTDGGALSAVAQAGDEYFPCGLYWNEFVFTIDDSFISEVRDLSGGVVVDDQGNVVKKRQLFIGIDKYEAVSPNDWAVWDNWRLKYYGAGEIDPDAIKGIESDEIVKTTAARKGIYNMLGQRLSKTQRGVNIIGGKKVIRK